MGGEAGDCGLATPDLFNREVGRASTKVYQGEIKFYGKELK
jgi:hypothetical protein